jgi:hypothetical protein
VHVGQEVVTLVVRLEAQELADRAEVVPDVEVAGWLDTRENAHELSFSSIIQGG